MKVGVEALVVEGIDHLVHRKKILRLALAGHSGMFFKVLFRCENVGRQDDLANF